MYKGAQSLGLPRSSRRRNVSTKPEPKGEPRFWYRFIRLRPTEARKTKVFHRLPLPAHAASRSSRCARICLPVQCRLNEERAAAGLPAASDDEVHDAIDSMRTAEDWNEFRREIQKGIDELDRGEGIPAEVALAELRERNKTFRKASQ